MKKQHDTLDTIAGLTLIEVLIAVILFSVIMLFGMSFFTFSSTSFGHSQNTTFAISLANDEMERLKTATWAGISSGVTDTTDTQTGIKYTVTRTVVNLPPAPATPTHKQITISVDWPGRKSTIDLVSIRAEN